MTIERIIIAVLIVFIYFYTLRETPVVNSTTDSIRTQYEAREIAKKDSVITAKDKEISLIKKNIKIKREILTKTIEKYRLDTIWQETKPCDSIITDAYVVIDSLDKEAQLYSEQVVTLKERIKIDDEKMLNDAMKIQKLNKDVQRTFLENNGTWIGCAVGIVLTAILIK